MFICVGNYNDMFERQNARINKFVCVLSAAAARDATRQLTFSMEFL